MGAMKISDRTLAEHLAIRLRGARVLRLHVNELGPDDMFYVSAMAGDWDGEIVECRAASEDLVEALVQLFKNIDTATAPED